MALLEQRQPLTVRFVSQPEELSGSEHGRVVSEQTYWNEYYHHPGFNYEWVNGRLEEKPMSINLTFEMYRWLLQLIERYLLVHPIATLTGLEMGFKVPLPPEKKMKRKKKRENVRKPDLGVVLKSNPVPAKPYDNRYNGIFDLCVEALSDTTKKAKERDTVEKKEEYEHVQVKEYYILDGKKTETVFYRINPWGIYEEIKPVDGDVIQSQVLPGFQFRISDLYNLTTPQELVKDDVYRGFIMLEYQTQKEEKEQARKEKEEAIQRAERAEQEKKEALKKAEEERIEKERLVALLKQLGISLD